MGISKKYKILCVGALIMLLSSCADNPGGSQRQTPYGALRSAMGYIGGGYKDTNVKRERSPLIHRNIYDRSERDVLVYIYQGNDQNNINFSKTLKEYADKAWLNVRAYTLDHHTVMEFPYSSYASEEVVTKYFGDRIPGIKTPVLFLEQYDAHTVTISVGDISFMQLVNKMNRIAEEREKQKY